MTTVVNKYRVYCQVENVFVYKWDTVAPTVCPNNNSHTIDEDNIAIIETTSQNNVSIIQVEPGKTGEHYRVEGKRMVIAPNSTLTLDFKWLYNISVLTVNFCPTEHNCGDEVNCFMAPDSTIGGLTAEAIQGDTVIHVSSTVLNYMAIGYLASLHSPNGSIQNLGECIGINSAASTITMERPVASNFPPGSLIKMSIQNVKNLSLHGDETIRLATKFLGSSLLPAGRIARFVYKNNGNVEKVFVFYFEYLL